MSGRIQARLDDLGLTLPAPAAPVAAYVAHVTSGKLVFVSGQLPLRDGRIVCAGHLGDGVSIEEGYAAAKLCGLNLLSQIHDAASDLDRVRRVIKLGGFVSCIADFTDHPKVINGASDLMLDVFGKAGRHTRFAVGAPSLPLGAAVEVDGLFELE